MITLDQECPEMLDSMIDLAIIFQDRNEHESAESLFRTIFNIGPIRNDDDSWDQLLEDFARTLIALNKSQEAEDIEQERADRESGLSSQTAWDAKPTSMLDSGDLANSYNLPIRNGIQQMPGNIETGNHDERAYMRLIRRACVPAVE